MVNLEITEAVQDQIASDESQIHQQEAKDDDKTQAKLTFAAALPKLEPHSLLASDNAPPAENPKDFSSKDSKKAKEDEEATEMASGLHTDLRWKWSPRLQLQKTLSFELPRISITECFPLNCTCMLCCATFESPFELQAHLVLLKHMPRPQLKITPFVRAPRFECVECHAYSVRQDHECVKTLADVLLLFVCDQLKDGSPLSCTMCDGAPLESIHHLIFHVVIFHGFRNLPLSDKHLSCPFCHALFKTRNSFVIEAHALDVHLPELVLRKQRQTHPENGEHFLKIRHFSCLFENSRYAALAKENSMQNCSATYTDLSGLIGHLCYAHFPVPKDFLPTKARPITCNACLFRFANRIDLRDHVHSSHQNILRFRAISLQDKVCFEDHCDPTKVCQLCWTNQGEVQRLQAHLLVYHVACWRSCGFCGRDFCGPGENVSAKILFLTMERHVDHHVKQLAEHFEEMSAICQYQKEPRKAPQPHDPDEDFFGKLVVHEHKNVSSLDETAALLAKMLRFQRPLSIDFDFL